MPIEHHPSPEYLAEYAAGVGTIGVDLIIACHATLCPICRREIEQLEQLGGAMAARSAAPAASSDPSGKSSGAPALDMDAFVGKMLHAVEGRSSESEHNEGGASVAPGRPKIFPAPLRAYLPDPSEVRWRRVLPGAARFDLDVPGHHGPPIHLKRLDPGLKIPHHGHRGQEFDLVLQGGIKDHSRSMNFDRGDLSYAEEGVDHRLSVLPGDVCITVSVAEAGVSASGWIARMLYKKAGW